MAYCCCPPSCGAMSNSKPIRVQYVGEPKLCSILCTQEVDQPSPTEPPRYRHRSNVSQNHMSVGILQSLVASHDKALYFDDTEMNGQRYAMCLKAFAFLFIVPVYKWTRKNLDNLMQEGAELYSAGPDEAYEKSKEQVGNSEVAISNQYKPSEQVIRRSFKLEGYEFEVELSDKFIPDKRENEVDQPTPQITFGDLKLALRGFFRKHNYCLLSSTNLYLFIWESNGIYFVLDFYGRDSNLELSREGGFATLICMREIRNVEHLVSEKSGLGKKDIFMLREMRLNMLVDPEGNARMSYFTSHRVDEFVQVSDEYAYLRSRLHLSLKYRDPLIARCGLPVGVAAIIASKIDHPASWDTKNLDKIICYGFYICQCCWQFCQNSQTPIDFDSFPNQLQVGQFAVSLTIVARICQGLWRPIPRYHPTELTSAFEKCWDSGYNCLLLTIQHQTYAIWRKNGFYYLFDPYRHRLPNSESKSASLRMFSTKEMFFNVLNLILLQNNTKTTFFVHRVVVTDIRASVGGDCVPPLPKPPCLEDLVEAKSINEGICFREDFKHCWKELGQISDEEEEDSVVEDIIEESEEGPPGEEEGGLFGDMEGVESSDEDGARRRRKRGRTPVGGKGRGGRSKSGRRKRGRSMDDDSTRRKSKAAKGGKKGGKRGKSPKDGGAGDSRRKSRSRKSKSLEPKSRKSRSKSKTRKSTHDKSRESSLKSRKSTSKSRKSTSKSRKSRSTSRISLAKRKSTRQSKSRRSKSRESIKKRKSTDKSKKDDKIKDEKVKDDKKETKKDDRSDTKKDQEKDSKKDDKKEDSKKDEKPKVVEDKSDKKKDDIKKEDIKKEEKAKTDVDKGKKLDESGGGKKDVKEEKVDKKENVAEEKTVKSDEGTPDSEKSSPEKDVEVKEKETRYDKDKLKDSGLSISYSHLHAPDDDVGRKKRKEHYEIKKEESYDQFGEGTVCRPNSYPGYSCIPFNLSVAGSENGSYSSLCKLLRTGFLYADRVLTMTPFGNFVVFRGLSPLKKTYFLFDGCTCNVERFRHLDLACGTAGLLCFNSLHSAVSYMIDSRSIRKSMQKNRRQVVDEICNQYCK